MAGKTDRGMENREIVLDILLETIENGSFIHRVLGQALNKYQYLDKPDRAFITRVSQGTLEYLIQIDWVINLYSKTKTQKMKPVIRNLLRLSVYQILYMDRVPDSAACNEAVKLARKRRFQGLQGFVNGVLRTISREKDSLSFDQPWIRLSLPQWLYSLWEETWGPQQVQIMGQAFLQKKTTAVRCNFSRVAEDKGPQAGAERILESLRSQNVEAVQDPLHPEILYLEQYDYLEALEAFQRGWIQVQDFSSILAGELAGPRKGDYCIDVCAAPGGKSLHLADLLQGTGMVEARDLTWQKVQLIQENIDRCGFGNIRARVQDALEEDEDSIEKADILIADLPCSGLGILGRKPDIKLHMTREKLDELAQLQRNILSVVWKYVKPGGKLVYSTCTIDPLENQENVRWIQENLPFRPVDLRGRLKGISQEDTLEHGYIQLLPGIHPGDGFFISVFTREA